MFFPEHDLSVYPSGKGHCTPAQQHVLVICPFLFYQILPAANQLEICGAILYALTFRESLTRWAQIIGPC